MDNTPVGLCRLAKIVGFDNNKGFIEAELELTNQTYQQTSEKKKKVQIPFPFYSIDGMFIGGKPQNGTPIIVSQGEGGQWYFVSFKYSDTQSLPALNNGEILAQANQDTYLSLNINGNITLGSNTHRTHINTTSNLEKNKISSNFSNKYFFSEAGREITGIIRREVVKDGITPNFLKLDNDAFDDKLTSIALDPTSTISLSVKGANKNPGFVENRKLIYEFSYSAKVDDDLNEANIYTNSALKNKSYTLPNRRESRADTLSLSLVSPNYLMETIAGTVVDIFGNILDLNRVPIPIGQNGISLKINQSSSTKEEVFSKIKELERKSIAYHFELNARKDLKGKNGQLRLPDVNSKDDYARSRSRFFFDIDKEGQFKINVPASSETGNIPLLVRYENYSTFGTEDDNNPNKLIFRDDNLDIFLDSFANNNGDIEIKDDNTIATPLDRIVNQHIKHGMPYHAITKSCQTFSPTMSSQILNTQYNPSVDVNSIPTIANIVSPIINISGSNANAGGRSGSINLDGSIELSIGANTIDRQSLWLDTAGGLIANLGRDKNNISAAMSLDGDLLIQVGGLGVSSDSRFSNLNNGYRAGAVDIRVMHQGFTATIVRIDNNGVSIISPNTISLHGRNINITAEADLNIMGDNVSINDRLVSKFPAASI